MGTEGGQLLMIGLWPEKTDDTMAPWEGGWDGWEWILSRYNPRMLFHTERKVTLWLRQGYILPKLVPFLSTQTTTFFRIGAPGRQIHFHISLLEIALRRTFHCMITLICAVCLSAKKDGAWSYVTPTHYQSGTFSSTAVEDIEIELDR